MFKPGKQYQYGLYLLGADADLTTALQKALAAAGAPPWPDGPDAKKALQDWVRAAVERGAEGRWWAIIEEHALGAIAADPGLSFGLGSVEELVGLPVIRSGAAKDLYGGPAAPQDKKALSAWLENRRTIADIITGNSLSIFHSPDARAAPRRDPIADVMVAAKAAIGQFGGALRRLVYSARKLSPDGVQQAQCLTEQVTQAALSVKAGKPPLRSSDFERQLRRLLQGESWQGPQQQELDALLAEIGKRLAPVWQHLCSLMSPEPCLWLEWLRKPHELVQLLLLQGEIRLPLDDLRLRCWLDEER
jgi:hypothetical protein